MILELGTIISHHYVEVLFNFIKLKFYSSTIPYIMLRTLKDSCQLQVFNGDNEYWLLLGKQLMSCYISFPFWDNDEQLYRSGSRDFGFEWEVGPIDRYPHYLRIPRENEIIWISIGVSRNCPCSLWIRH